MPQNVRASYNTNNDQILSCSFAKQEAAPDVLKQTWLEATVWTRDPARDIKLPLVPYVALTERFLRR